MRRNDPTFATPSVLCMLPATTENGADTSQTNTTTDKTTDGNTTEESVGIATGAQLRTCAMAFMRHVDAHKDFKFGTIINDIANPPRANVGKGWEIGGKVYDTLGDARDAALSRWLDTLQAIGEEAIAIVDANPSANIQLDLPGMRVQNLHGPRIVEIITGTDKAIDRALRKSLTVKESK